MPKMLVTRAQCLFDSGENGRVFATDLNSDGIPEIIAPNKGAQRPRPADYARSTPVELFTLHGDPLDGDSWQREILGRYSIPQNSETVDLDGDGDCGDGVGTGCVRDRQGAGCQATLTAMVTAARFADDTVKGLESFSGRYRPASPSQE